MPKISSTTKIIKLTKLAGKNEKQPQSVKSQRTALKRTSEKALQSDLHENVRKHLTDASFL